MIVSSGSGASEEEFRSLMCRVTKILNNEAKSDPTMYVNTYGKRLETVVFEKLKIAAAGTSFEGTIELISGQKFPDIVARKCYGIEVKSTTQDHWTTTGNSVSEQTRVDGVERIYILFGKLQGQIEFICRPYEECLSDIVVTHSPRYRIDMRLAGQTILDQMGIKYDDLRRSVEPLRVVTDYYRRILPRSQQLWWLGGRDDDHETSIIVKNFGQLEVEEKRRIRGEAFVFFPEILGPSSRSKYNRLAVWLVARHGVVCFSARDLFSAGGKVTMSTRSGKCAKVPRVFGSLRKLKGAVLLSLDESERNDLEHYWGVKAGEKTNRYRTWLKLAQSHAAPCLLGTGITIEDILA